MIVRAISDTHIGIKDNSNDFIINMAKFIEFIETSCDTCDHFVIVGDFLELWESKEVGNYHQTYIEVCRANTDLINCLNKYSDKILYVAGNHDYFIFNEKNSFPLYPLTELDLKIGQNKIIHFEHGNSADIFNSKFKFIGAFITFCAAWFERIINPDFDYMAGKFEKMIPGRKSDDKVYLKYARKLHEKNEYDIVVFGHTHRKKIESFQINNKLKFYVNTGSGHGKIFLDVTDIIISDNDIKIKQFEQSF